LSYFVSLILTQGEHAALHLFTSILWMMIITIPDVTSIWAIHIQ